MLIRTIKKKIPHIGNKSLDWAICDPKKEHFDKSDHVEQKSKNCKQRLIQWKEIGFPSWRIWKKKIQRRLMEMGWNKSQRALSDEPKLERQQIQSR